MTPQRPRRSRRRPTTLSPIQQLEQRQLMAGAAAVWLGQDGQDKVGPYAAEQPDGIQDVHIQVVGLPGGRTIASAELTGLGGSRWVYNMPGNSWRAAVSQPTAGQTTADLFVEADRVETGRPFNLVLTLDDDARLDLWFDGGAADPNLRTEAASLRAAWLGQIGDDRTGPTAAVGPDGLIDAAINLTGLAADNPLISARVTDPNGLDWVYGTNPEGRPNAEVVRSATDPTQGTLWFSPSYDLKGRSLRVDLIYATGRTDSAVIPAGAVNPLLAVTTTAPAAPVRTGVSVSWIGQDGIAATAGRGWARLAVSSLPAGRTVVGATLTGASATQWNYRAASSSVYASNPYSELLDWRPDPANTPGGWLAFAPDQVTSEPYTLSLAFDDGSIAVARVSPGAVDLSRLSPLPVNRTVIAAPGANLNALAKLYGRIELAPGRYPMTEPLILDKPVTIVAPQGGATLLFAQPPGSPAWDQAILIHSGNTTLDGFAIRFEGSVRWNDAVSYGPAVIGTTDLHDRNHLDPKANLLLQNLDIVSPAASGSTPVESPRVMRLVTASSGKVLNNLIQGGVIEAIGGPWTIAGNTFLGAAPGTWAWDVIAAHRTHDLRIENNVVAPATASGRIWRFVVLTGGHQDAAIAGNRVSGLGHVDGDTEILNANEVILTEAYALRFEGRALNVSQDGYWLDIPTPQGDPVQTGDLVAILSGPNAGRSARVAQAVSPTRLLLEDPLPPGQPEISIGPGQLNLSIERNTIDLSRSSIGSALVLAGLQIGTRVVDNTLIGGGDALRLTAFPTERPIAWGWSHTPVLNAIVSGNSFLDAALGARLTVEHGPLIKSTKGRTYLSATVEANTIRWSQAFLDRRAAAGLPAPEGWSLGDRRTIDPAEMSLTWGENFASAPPGSAAVKAFVIAAHINGTDYVDTSFVLGKALSLPPAAPAFLRLLNDTGTSATDGITQDPRIVIGSSPGAVSYEYRPSDSTRYLPLTNPAQLDPQGLADGLVQISVRARNADSVAGPDVTLQFVLDRTGPAIAAPILDRASDTGGSDSDRITRARQLTFLVTLEPSERAVLERDGVPVAAAVSGSLVDPNPLNDGTSVYRVRRFDAAGNQSLSEPTAVRMDRSTPVTPVLLETNREGLVRLPELPPDERYDYRVPGGFFQPAPSSTFTPAGLRFGVNRVEFRTSDLAGNISQIGSADVLLAPASPTGIWLGQDGRDLVGPTTLAVPDGRVDIHIAVGGLSPQRRIRLVEVRGDGGGRWVFGPSVAPAGAWHAAFIRRPGATTADLYFQPDRIETGRLFTIRLVYGDGSEAQFVVQGGRAEPRRPVSALGTPQPAGSVVMRGPRALRRRWRR